MNYSFTLTNIPQGQLFESKRRLPIHVHKTTTGHVCLNGILHSIYSTVPFVLYNYLGTHLTSKKIDKHNFMIHFPSGTPITPEMDVSVVSLDPATHIYFDIHYEMAILDLDIPPNICVRGPTGIIRFE